MARRSPERVSELVDRARRRDVRAISRLLTMAESPEVAMAELGPMLATSASSRTHIVGVTGPPGSGKSTVTSALVSAYRARDLRVAVLAVDPSSPYSGGALLGDRIRMLGHTQDDDVFIRSMASRGHLGGLATAALAAISILSATGFDVLIVETVGVGQSEIEIVELSDTTVLLMSPNAGDGVQAVKAGIIEIADVLVVNKADLPDADRTVRELRGAIRLSRAAGEGWVPPVVTSVAREPDGVQQVVAAIDGHRAWLDGDPLRKRRRQRTAEAIRRIAIDNFAKEVRVSETLAERVERGEIDLWSAAAEVTSGVGQDFRSSNTSDILPR